MAVRDDKPTSSSAASLRTRLMAIDAEMADLHTRWQRLAIDRKPVVEALKSIVYPVLTLPTEITAEIFKQSVDEWITVAREQWLGPQVLASVCRAWRHIAINMHSMWSTIYVPNTYDHNTEKLLRWWLPRVGGHPLKLAVPDFLFQASSRTSGAASHF
ncbi:hypothetical protein B0H19DRAFT_1159652 [Mycena capillaripes]|nr:hypothetical protein B0H19DRAFT_1159652 [Mycena capillaripes]